MRRTDVILGLATVLLSALAATAAAQQGNARAAIEAANKMFVAAANKADAAGVAALYSTTAQAFPPNAPIVSGRAAIQELWKGVFSSGITSVSLTTSEVEAQGDLAYEVGSYEMKLKDGKVADRGKYCVVWKRENGQWRLHRDIWNTNMPATK